MEVFSRDDLRKHNRCACSRGRKCPYGEAGNGWFPNYGGLICLRIRKIVLVGAPQFVADAGRDADAVVDHQFSEASAVDKDDLLADLGDTVARALGEGADC